MRDPISINREPVQTFFFLLLMVAQASSLCHEFVHLERWGLILCGAFACCVIPSEVEESTRSD